MFSETVDTMIYYLFFVLNFAPWFLVVAGAIWWYVAHKANKTHQMGRALKVVVVSLIFIYITRFIAISSFSMMYERENTGRIDIKQFKDVFTLVQWLLVAFLPSFAYAQSTIYNYQRMFTEDRKRESSVNQKSSILIGIAIAIAGVLILEFFKNLFIY